MPVYNEQHFIKDAVLSVLEQNGDFDVEIIIVNDHSTDDTRHIVRELSQAYPNIKYTDNIKKGKNHAFNTAYDLSQGDFLALFAGDDIMPQGALRERLAPIKDLTQERAVSLCKLRTFSEWRKFDGIITPRDPRKGALIGGALLMTRQFAEICFPLPVVLANEDKWIVCHVEHFHDIVIKHVAAVGLEYRIHANNSSSRTQPFREKTKEMHLRFIVYSVFLERYRNVLSDASINILSLKAAAETLRYAGSTLSILLMRGLNLADRARFVMHSKPILYWIRIKLFSLLSGR